MFLLLNQGGPLTPLSVGPRVHKKKRRRGPPSFIIHCVKISAGGVSRPPPWPVVTQTCKRAIITIIDKATLGLFFFGEVD